MNWHLVNYANKKFYEKQYFIKKIHSKNFNIISYNRDFLVTTNFYKNNKNILDEEIGAGWWIWKPYLILESLLKIDKNDYLIYCDCGDMISPNIKSYIKNVMSENDPCLLLLGNNKNKEYTKRDCFILMDCDGEDYWNSYQLEAGVQVWRRNEKAINIISNWMEFCLDPKIIKNNKSILENEFDSFKEHRNDQSILTNIAIREGLSVGNQEFRNFIECDYDYWYERYPNSYLGRDIDEFLLSIKNA